MRLYYQKDMNQLIELDNIIIEPKCKATIGNGKGVFHKTMGNLYITSKGYVLPCCWFGITRRMTGLWNESGIDKKYHNIHHYSVEEIIKGPIFEWIENNMTGLEVCQTNCAKEERDKPL